MLQETHIAYPLNKHWKKEWNGRCFFSGTKTNKEGVAILVNGKLNIKIKECKEIIVGRLVTMDITIQEKEFVIINIYGPNHDNDNVFFEKLNEIIDMEKNIIIGGDFNTVLNTYID